MLARAGRSSAGRRGRRGHGGWLVALAEVDGSHHQAHADQQQAQPVTPVDGAHVTWYLSCGGQTTGSRPPPLTPQPARLSPHWLNLRLLPADYSVGRQSELWVKVRNCPVRIGSCANRSGWCGFGRRWAATVAWLKLRHYSGWRSLALRWSPWASLRWVELWLLRYWSRLPAVWWMWQWRLPLAVLPWLPGPSPLAPQSRAGAVRCGSVGSWVGGGGSGVLPGVGTIGVLPGLGVRVGTVSICRVFLRPGGWPGEVCRQHESEHDH